MKIIRPYSVDFASAFSRASDATYFDADGVLQTASSNVPRWGYDPETLEPIGLIKEAAATNYLTYSEDLTNAAWTKTGVTISANATDAPDGNTTADLVVASASAGAHRVDSNQSGDTLAAGVNVFSCFVKAGGYATGMIQWDGTIDSIVSSMRCIFDLSAVTASPQLTTSGNLTAINAGIKPLPADWFRVWIYGTASDTSGVSGTCRLYLTQSTSFTGDGVSGLHYWGMQLEAVS